MRQVRLFATSLTAIGLVIHSTAVAYMAEVNSAANVQFSAAPKKAEFVHGEKVEFVFSVRNAGAQDVLVARPFLLNHYVYLRVVGPEGKEIAWCGKIDGRLVSPGEFVILRPGASVKSTVRLSCDEHKDSGYVLDRAGKYRVDADYFVPYPQKWLKRTARHALIIKKRLHAPPVEITITATRQ